MRDAAGQRADVARLLLPHRSRWPPAAPGVRPLSDHALASRLSYFLWSSMPDAELLAHARAGDLHRPEVLAAQARRMLKDPRVRGLATEFGGNWLDFRRFEEHNAVDRERFPTFTNELRAAMFEEPVRFLLDVFRSDRSVLDLLYGDHTFVNAGAGQALRHAAVDQARGRGRLGARRRRRPLRPRRAAAHGGVPDQERPGLRTSPVKRGYWVVKNVLGERIPPPPAVVPELPRDEAKLDLPLRELLARHREDPACAGCHARFDAWAWCSRATAPSASGAARIWPAGRSTPAPRSPAAARARGLAGLRDYLREQRQDDFVDNLCAQAAGLRAWAARCCCRTTPRWPQMKAPARGRAASASTAWSRAW